MTTEETPAAYGALLSCKPSYIANYFTFRRLPNPPTRLGRREVTRTVYSVRWRTILPNKYKRFNDNQAVREGQNVHAFFRMLEHHKNIG